MATYNGEKYLREQLDSVLQQTYSDFELVICDDHSTDKTLEIVQEYALRDSRIRYSVNPTNLGFRRNFEHAIELCKGEYIALCDQDDIWKPDHLEVLYRNIDNCAISCADAELVDLEGRPLNMVFSKFVGFYNMPDERSKLIYKILLRGNFIQGASMLLRTSFICKCTPIPDAVLYHDAWFAACACLDDGINFSFESITLYRQHKSNVTKHLLKISSSPFIFYIKLLWKAVKNRKIYTDRFEYIDRLYQIYGLENQDFAKLYSLLKRIESRKVTLSDIQFLWNNYNYISTQNTKRGFVKNLFCWLHWSPIESK